jgi:hypothetical protein
MMALGADEVGDFDRFLLTNFDLIAMWIFIDSVDDEHNVAFKCQESAEVTRRNFDESLNGL